MSRKRLAYSIALLLVLLLLLVALAGDPLVNRARVAYGGKPLLRALLERARIGALPLGPDTPPAWALARASDPAHEPDAAAGDRPGSDPGQSVGPGPRAPDTAARELAVERNLRQAAARLRPAAGADRLLGVALGSQGSYLEAENALTVGELAHPQDPFVRLAMGNVLDAQGLREAALATWKDADLPRALSLQLYREGARLANESRRAEAEALLLLATQVDPGFADPYHALGGFYWGVDSEKSAANYQASLDKGGLEPFFEWFARGKLALLDNRYRDAVEALEEAVRLRPEHPEATLLLGTALHGVGRPQEALGYLEEAARLSPNSPWPLTKEGEIYLERAAYPEAIAALAAAIERRPDVDVAFDLLGQAYIGSGQPVQAAAAWRQAVSLQPQQVTYHLRLGDALRLAGDEDGARAAYRQALQLDPANAYAADQLRRLGQGLSETPQASPEATP